MPTRHLKSDRIFLLSVNEDFTISFGDLLEWFGALLWTCHIHLIGWLAPKTVSLRLAFIQFAVNRTRNGLVGHRVFRFPRPRSNLILSYRFRASISRLRCRQRRRRIQ